MKMAIRLTMLASLLVFMGAGSARAWHIDGHVYCAGTGLPLGGVLVTVDGCGFSDSATTSEDGAYYIGLPDVPCASYTATIPGGFIVDPLPGYYSFATTDANPFFTGDFVVNDPRCVRLGCWLTGGGTKFSTILGIAVAEKGPKVNFGGNVNPSCSPEPGEGGNWNHLDRDSKLHFQGTAITVDRCGNVDGIPPGSTSPVTPFNFIEFHGTGKLKGFAGNSFGPADVCFTARAEDRNEPGSGGQNDGAGKDRYFIEVTDCAGTQLLVLGGPSNPVTISGGNLQLHVSSCP
jgi:hypothetical protein